MPIIKIFLKLLLIPVWLLLAAAGLIVRLIVNIYGIGRAIAVFILTMLFAGVIVCYQDWVQAVFLIVLYIILFAIMFFGVALEVCLEHLRDKVMKTILL